MQKIKKQLTLFSLIALLIGSFFHPQTAQAAAPTSGLVGYWKLDESSGTSASDSSGNSRTGTLTNGPTFSTGRVNNGLNFDGSNDYVSVPSFNLSGTGFTLSAWINSSAPGNTQTIIFKGLNFSSEYYLILEGSHIQCGHADNNFYWLDSANTITTANQWYHVACTYNTSGNAVATYINGSLSTSGAFAAAPTLNSNPLVFGNDPNLGEYFQGKIDEARIYSRALSAAEVLDIYNDLGGGSTPPPTPPPPGPTPPPPPPTPPGPPPTPPPSGSTFYIRDGGTSSACSDWTNACDSLPTSLNRGATYYIADGSYAGYTFDDPNSGTSIITIKKATASDHGANTGWQSTYGDGQANFSGEFRFLTSYWNIDGATGGGPGSWDSGHGFKFGPQSTAVSADLPGVGNISIKHAEMHGRGAAFVDQCGQMVSLHAFTGAGSPNWTFSHNYFHDLESGAFHIANFIDFLAEYNYIIDSPSSSSCHGEAVYGQQGSRATFRYNLWRNVEGTGVIMLWGDRFDVHGNVIWWTGVPYNGHDFHFVSNGSIAGWGNYAVTNSNIYNNTIVNGAGLNQGIAFLNPGSSGNNIRNNLLVGNESVYFGGGSEGNNVVDNNSSRFQNYTPTNFSTLDLRLKSALLGTALASSYNQDLLGSTRGSDGVWDLGAYEFTSGGATPPPPTPVPGDLNLDHVVNSLDFSLLNSRWNTNFPSYDLVVDGLINSLDFAILSSNWLRTW